MPSETDSWDAMMSAVRAFHDKHQLREKGGEELTYRVALMAEELGEVSACITKGKARTALAEELADLVILILGTDIVANLERARLAAAKAARDLGYRVFLNHAFIDGDAGQRGAGKGQGRQHGDGGLGDIQLDQVLAPAL